MARPAVNVTTSILERERGTHAIELTESGSTLSRPTTQRTARKLRLRVLVASLLGVR